MIRQIKELQQSKNDNNLQQLDENDIIEIMEWAMRHKIKEQSENMTEEYLNKISKNIDKLKKEKKDQKIISKKEINNLHKDIISILQNIYEKKLKNIIDIKTLNDNVDYIHKLCKEIIEQIYKTSFTTDQKNSIPELYENYSSQDQNIKSKINNIFNKKPIQLHINSMERRKELFDKLVAQETNNNK